MRQAEAAGRRAGWMVLAIASMCALLTVDGRSATAGTVVLDDEPGSQERIRTMPVQDVDGSGEATYEAVELVEADPCAAYPSRDPEVEPLWKLGRGLHNMVFGFPAEVLRNPVIEILKADTVFGVGAGAFEGVLLGVGKGFWRVGAGFLDVVTFPMTESPWYHCRYLPEYPF